MSLEQDAFFWGSLAVIVVSAYKFTVKYCYNSKCENFSCFWGMLRIQRNIQAEVEIQRAQIEHDVASETDVVEGMQASGPASLNPSAAPSRRGSFGPSPGPPTITQNPMRPSSPV